MIAPNILYTTQLSVVAAFVDGQVSEEEIATIILEVSTKFKTDATEIENLVRKLVASYQNKDIATNPVTALRMAVTALRGLSKRDALVAFTIANKVLACGGHSADEDSFIYQLSLLV